MFKLNEYTNFDELSRVLVDKWLDIIKHTPPGQPCSFALAGGTTPAPLYRQFDADFAKSKLRDIQLVATDERWVPDSDPESNEGLFQRCFTQSKAQWHLLSLKNNHLNPAAAVADINARLQENINHPFSTLILGMGTDGHVASLFPDAPHLLIEDKTSNCVAALHPQTQQARISLSFSRLLNTNSIWVVITGTEKRAVLENASPSLPIRALLSAARCDVEIFWCP
jgi:6-phosphogluconolactonase